PGDGPVPIVLHHPDGTLPPAIAQQLEREDIVILWHNGSAFDGPVLAFAGLDVSRIRAIDTLVCARVLLSGQWADQDTSHAADDNVPGAGYEEEALRWLKVVLPGDKKVHQKQDWVKKESLSQDDVAYCSHDTFFN